jgi:hypothetical protein
MYFIVITSRERDGIAVVWLGFALTCLDFASLVGKKRRIKKLQTRDSVSR